MKVFLLLTSIVFFGCHSNSEHVYKGHFLVKLTKPEHFDGMYSCGTATVRADSANSR
jgi:hypothetical protein